jgi:tetratricopeptide (TPR) repeat protein
VECDKTLADEQRRLHRLLDEDPRAAIAEADKLQPSHLLSQRAVANLRAGIYTDAGAAVRDPALVRKGASVFRRDMLANPQAHSSLYNLANSLMAYAELHAAGSDNQLQLTSGLRRAARAFFAQAARSPTPELATQAKTNQGNILLKAARRIEAYDCYAAALGHDPGNGVAGLRMAELLLRYAKSDLVSSDGYESLASTYLARAARNSETTRRYGGKAAVDRVAELLASRHSVSPLSTARNPTRDEYLGFVVRERLLLAPDIACCATQERRYDRLGIPFIVEAVGTPFGVPAIFAMFNCLLSDYLTARWLAFASQTAGLPETGYYSDTLDYAKYGVCQSAQLAAQRLAVDLLDKVAVAASEHFGLPGSPASIAFVSRWHSGDHSRGGSGLVLPLQLQDQVLDEIGQGNAGLAALAELAEDIAARGSLYSKRVLRNESTHRFVVLHDEGASPSRDTPRIAHYQEGDMRDETLESLRTARAAIFYLRDAIVAHEQRMAAAAKGPIGKLEVYPHDVIRGGDEA